MELVSSMLNRNSRIETTPFRARGRVFTTRQLEIISHICDKYSHEGRTQISRRVCKALAWKQSNGNLKDIACREVLRKLDQLQIICLPEGRSRGATWKETNSRQFLPEQNYPIITTLRFNEIIIRKISSNENLLWNNFVTRYHYLRSSRIVGRQVKYIAFSKDEPIAFFGWGDSSWAIKDRDHFIGWNSYQRSKNRYMIINNTRFLILPWVKVPNLASYLIAKCSKLVLEDWESYYGYRPVLLETFVDISHFVGTCYKAANWLYVGQSKGYSKQGASHHNSQSPKAVYLYPLTDKFKEILKGRHLR